jgi:hypothetical protein
MNMIELFCATQNTGDYLSTSEEALEPNLEILTSKEPVDLSVKFNKARIKAQQRKPNRYFQPSKPVSLYFSAMPLVNYYTITPNGSDSKYVHNIEVDDDNSRIGVYLQAGLKFTLSDRLQLKRVFLIPNLVKVLVSKFEQIRWWFVV